MLYRKQLADGSWGVFREDLLTPSDLRDPFILAQRETHELAQQAAWAAMNLADGEGLPRDEIDEAGRAAYRRVTDERREAEVAACTTTIN